MNNIKFEEGVCKTLGGFAIALGIGLTGVGEAQAGAVSGNFDPAFGPALPGWNYEGAFTLSFSDEWTSAAYGGYQTDAGANHTRLDLVSLGTAMGWASDQVIVQTNVSMQKSGVTGGSNRVGLSLQAIIFETTTGLLTDWESSSVIVGGDLASGSGLNDIVFDDGTHGFQFKWSSLLGGPGLSCLDCAVSGGARGAVDGSLDGLKVSYLQTYDNSTEPTGNVITTYASDGQGGFTRSTLVTHPGDAQVIPEPGSMALVLAALLGVGWMRSRKV
jgi:hypothetical protein